MIIINQFERYSHRASRNEPKTNVTILRDTLHEPNDAAGVKCLVSGVVGAALMSSVGNGAGAGESIFHS